MVMVRERNAKGQLLPGKPHPVPFIDHSDEADDDGITTGAAESSDGDLGVSTFDGGQAINRNLTVQAQVAKRRKFRGDVVALTYKGCRDPRARVSYAISVIVPDDLESMDKGAPVTEGTSYTFIRDQPAFVPEDHVEWLTNHYYHRIERD